MGDRRHQSRLAYSPEEDYRGAYTCWTPFIGAHDDTQPQVCVGDTA